MKFSIDVIVKYLEEKKIDAAREYMASCIPDTLSKFYSLTDDTELNDKKLNCLANDCNWYENPKNQNDPFDMRMGYIDESHAKKLKLSSKTVEVEKKILDEVIEQMLSCSFVDSDYRNLPMWSYYANNYQGYCVNYKIHFKTIFFKVIYQKTKLSLAEFFLVCFELCIKEKEGYNTETGQDMIAFLVQLIFSLKHSSWRHEKEYRIIWSLSEEIGQRISNMEMGLEVNDITIGLKCKPEYKERILQIAKDRKIKCYQLYTDENKFLSRQLINL